MLVSTKKSHPDWRAGGQTIVVVGCLDVQSSTSCGRGAQADMDAQDIDNRRCGAPSLTTLLIR